MKIPTTILLFALLASPVFAGDPSTASRIESIELTKKHLRPRRHHVIRGVASADSGVSAWKLVAITQPGPRPRWKKIRVRKNGRFAYRTPVLHRKGRNVVRFRTIDSEGGKNPVLRIWVEGRGTNWNVVRRKHLDRAN